MKFTALFALALSAAPALGQGLQQKLLGLDTGAGDQFGSSVVIQGDRAVVGAPSFVVALTDRPGAAYVFENSNGTWTQTARLTSPAPFNNEQFGSAVAIDGDRIVVGAHGSGIGPLSWAGAAYLFEKTPGGWVHSFTFAPSDPQQSQLFGHYLDIEGDRVVIGAEYDDNAIGNGAGAVYVFDLIGGVWQETVKLTSATAGPNGRLGTQVDLDGDRLLTGAPRSGLSGHAYLFELQAGVWVETQEFTATSPITPRGFGEALALEGTTAVIGAYAEEDIGWRSGAAYVFENGPGGWAQTQRLLPIDQQVGAHFGRALALDGDVLAISGHRENLPGALNAGRIHRFERDGSGWHELGTLEAAAPVAELGFGQALAIDAGTILAGAPDEASLGVLLGKANGAAYFTRFATLTSAPASISVTAGGGVLHSLDLGVDYGGQLFMLFTSSSGISPGLVLGPVEVPLVVDSLTLSLLPFSGSLAISHYIGNLSMVGVAFAQLSIPPGLSPTLVGLTIYQAGLIFDTSGNVVFATNPTRFELLP